MQEEVESQQEESVEESSADVKMNVMEFLRDNPPVRELAEVMVAVKRLTVLLNYAISMRVQSGMPLVTKAGVSTVSPAEWEPWLTKMGAELDEMAAASVSVTQAQKDISQVISPWISRVAANQDSRRKSTHQENMAASTEKSRRETLTTPAELGVCKLEDRLLPLVITGTSETVRNLVNQLVYNWSAAADGELPCAVYLCLRHYSSVFPACVVSSRVDWGEAISSVRVFNEFLLRNIFGWQSTLPSFLFIEYPAGPDVVVTLNAVNELNRTIGKFLRETYGCLLVVIFPVESPVSSEFLSQWESGRLILRHARVYVSDLVEADSPGFASGRFIGELA